MDTCTKGTKGKGIHESIHVPKGLKGKAYMKVYMYQRDQREGYICSYTCTKTERACITKGKGIHECINIPKGHEGRHIPKGRAYMK